MNVSGPSSRCAVASGPAVLARAEHARLRSSFTSVRDNAVSGPAGDSRGHFGGRFTPSGPVVLGVLGGSGGVGTSCLAAAVATRMAARGDSTLIVDSDPTFGRLDALFDRDGVAGVRWADLAGAQGSLEGRALLDVVPRSAEGVRILAGGGQPVAPDELEVPSAATMTGVLTALLAPEAGLDVVVLDLHRAAPPLAQWCVLCADLVLVVGSGVSALACATTAARLVQTLAATSCRLWLAQRGPRTRRDVADVVADAIGLPLIAFVTDDPGLDERLARGRPPGTGKGPLAGAADVVVRRLGAPREGHDGEPAT